MSALLVNKYDPSVTETLQTTALRWGSGPEPASGDILRTFTVNFQGSVFVRDAQGDEIIIGGGGRLGCRFIYPTAQPGAVQTAMTLEFEE